MAVWAPHTPRPTPSKTLEPPAPAGPGLVLAKAVQDCAQGGMVLLAEGTFSQLGVEELHGALLVGARLHGCWCMKGMLPGRHDACLYRPGHG